MILPSALILLISTEAALSATLEPVPEQIAVFREAIGYVFADSFENAYNALEAMPDDADGRPVYHLLYGAVVHAEMLDAEDYSDERAFFGHIDTSIDLLEKWTEAHPGDAWGVFFLGTAHGYKSLLYAQQGHWLKSLISGLKARGRFKKAIELDPGLYDAYTGMGNYHYWSTVKLGRYIPFLPDNRKMGISELKLAADSSLFSGLPAMAGLAWAYINEKDLKPAIAIGKRMEEETGGARNSLWILGGAYWRTGNLDLAASYYSRLMDSFKRTGKQNHYNLIFCGYRRGVCYFKTGKIMEARKDLESIFSYDITRDVRKRHKETFQSASDYLKKIDKILRDREKSL